MFAFYPTSGIIMFLDEYLNFSDSLIRSDDFDFFELQQAVPHPGHSGRSSSVCKNYTLYLARPLKYTYLYTRSFNFPSHYSN